MCLYTKRITSVVIMMRMIVPTATVTATAIDRAVGLDTSFPVAFSGSITISHYCTLIYSGYA